MPEFDKDCINNGAFDPSSLGFDASFNTVNRPHRCYSSCNYLRSHKNGWVVLDMNAEASEFIRLLSGDTCDFAVNEKGQVLIYAGTSRKLIRCAKRTKRLRVAMGVAHGELKKHFGDFTKVRMKATPYAQGKALLFTAEEVA